VLRPLAGGLLGASEDCGLRQAGGTREVEAEFESAVGLWEATGGNVASSRCSAFEVGPHTWRAGFGLCFCRSI